MIQQWSTLFGCYYSLYYICRNIECKAFQKCSRDEDLCSFIVPGLDLTMIVIWNVNISCGNSLNILIIPDPKASLKTTVCTDTELLTPCSGHSITNTGFDLLVTAANLPLPFTSPLADAVVSFCWHRWRPATEVITTCSTAWALILPLVGFFWHFARSTATVMS